LLFPAPILSVLFTADNYNNVYKIFVDDEIKYGLSGGKDMDKNMLFVFS